MVIRASVSRWRWAAVDCTAGEIERVRRLLDDVLGIGGLFVPRLGETTAG